MKKQINIMKTAETPEQELFKSVKKIALSDIMPGYSFPIGADYAIIDKNENILNFCSSKYNLVANDKIFLPVEETLKSKGLEFNRNIKIVNGSKFYVDYIIKQGAELKVNDVYPKISVWNSYDGVLKFRTEFGYYRLVCSNVLSTPTELVNRSLSKHSTDEAGIGSGTKTLLQEFISSTNRFLKQTSEDFELYKWMEEKKFTIESLSKVAEKAGLSRKMTETAIERYKLELTGGVNYSDINNIPTIHAGGAENMFLGYNALNYAIYNTNEKELPEKKLEKDIKLINTMKEELILA